MSRVPVPVDRALVGFVDSPATPTADPRRLGSVSMTPAGPFTVRQVLDLRLVYTVGHHGLDDRGALKVVMRFPGDGGDWQTHDPDGLNFVTVEASRPCGFRVAYEAFGDARPWFKVLSARVVGGCLSEGDTVTITVHRLRLQTFAEDAWELRFLVDACATGHFVEVPDALWAAIEAGDPARWCAVSPTRAPVGESFRLGLKVEDAHGNPTTRVRQRVRLEPSLPVRGLPDQVEHTGPQMLDGLVCDTPGVLRITVRDEAGAVLATSNPTRVGAARTLWGDLHGQSGETVGINTAEAYLRFARDKAFLDVTSHQANDFQITSAFWQQLNELAAAFDEPGRFVCLPGYEWSGNTAVGGDRNVFFRHDHRPIRRSSHALLLDRSDIDSDCTTAAALFEALADEDAVVYAHVGGRWADLRRAHDPRTEHAVELHSAWGTFEWLLKDAFALGHRVGVVANSDGHKGRPGASWPGAATFGAYGGLTNFLTEDCTRDGVLRAIRERRTVATTGCRLDLDVAITDDGGEDVGVTVEVLAPAPVAWIEVRVGAEAVARHRPYGAVELGARVAVRWEGARYRGRGRQVCWDGAARFDGARILGIDRVNAFNPDHAFEHDEHHVRWQAVTTGNFGGFHARVDEGIGARLRVDTEHAWLDVALAERDAEGVRVDAGGLGMALSAHRLPDVNRHLDVTFSCRVPVRGEAPVWVAVELEDGHRAWSSPVWVVRA